MFKLEELRNFLKMNKCDFEIIKHDKPIISLQDASQYFDIEKAVPTFIMDTNIGLVALITKPSCGKIDFKSLNKKLNFSKFKMANKDKISKIGYEIGSIPLIGHNLPCIFDKSLLKYDYIYGGSGDELHTLKISPNDVLKSNNTIKTI